MLRSGALRGRSPCSGRRKVGCVEILIGNAPCSWGVEFPDDPGNPPWGTVLRETAEAGYAGTELGPVGFIPEDPGALADRLEQLGLRLTGAVLFRPFHDPQAWDSIRDGLERSCRMLRPLAARHLVMIDSLSPERTPHAGSPDTAPRLRGGELAGLHDRLREAARIASRQYGLIPSLHPHAGGCIEFGDEVDGALGAIDESLMGLCLDTGHSLFAGLDPVRLLRRYADRLRYVHLKDLDRGILRRCVATQAGFYEACNQGVFCRLGRGDVDFHAVKAALEEISYRGWCTVEQDRGPDTLGSPYDDAVSNRGFLTSLGWGA